MQRFGIPSSQAMHPLLAFLWESKNTFQGWANSSANQYSPSFAESHLPLENVSRSAFLAIPAGVVWLPEHLARVQAARGLRQGMNRCEVSAKNNGAEWHLE